VALRIVETAFGPVLIDDEHAGPTMSSAPTRLELLAVEIGLDADALRDRLRGEIQRRRRERGDAWKQLDETLEKRENGRNGSVPHPRVASAGDSPDVTPVAHQHET
jgi:hypothetical protein